MLRTHFLGRSVFTAMLSMIACTCFGQNHLDCQRVDQAEQQLAQLLVEARASSSWTPGYQTDSDGTYLPQNDEVYLYWDSQASAASNQSDSSSLLQITVQNPTAWNDITAVPQVAFAIGGILTANASPTYDPGGFAWSHWAINSEYAWFSFPSFATGTYKILGDDEVASLYGMMDIILVFNTIGNWDLWDTHLGPEWTVRCGSSSLSGKRTLENDGWYVGGVVWIDDEPVPVSEFWGDNVNEIIYPGEIVHSGNHRDVEIVVHTMDVSCWANAGDTTESAVVSSFTFGSGFEVELDVP